MVGFAARGETIENKIMKCAGGWREFANFSIRGKDICSVRDFRY